MKNSLLGNFRKGTSGSAWIAVTMHWISEKLFLERPGISVCTVLLCMISFNKAWTVTSMGSRAWGEMPGHGFVAFRCQSEGDRVIQVLRWVSILKFNLVYSLVYKTRKPRKILLFVPFVSLLSANDFILQWVKLLFCYLYKSNWKQVRHLLSHMKYPQYQHNIDRRTSSVFSLMVSFFRGEGLTFRDDFDAIQEQSQLWPTKM